MWRWVGVRACEEDRQMMRMCASSCVLSVFPYLYVEWCVSLRQLGSHRSFTGKISFLSIQSACSSDFLDTAFLELPLPDHVAIIRNPITDKTTHRVMFYEYILKLKEVMWRLWGTFYVKHKEVSVNNLDKKATFQQHDTGGQINWWQRELLIYSFPFPQLFNMTFSMDSTWLAS